MARRPYKYRKPGSLHGRFQHITNDCGHVVYVAEFSNGVVKLGMTQSARWRLSATLTEARRLFGPLEVVRFDVSPDLESRMETRRLEAAALDRVRRVAQPAIGTKRHSEYFTGITYDAALEVVRETLGSPPPPPH